MIATIIVITNMCGLEVLKPCSPGTREKVGGLLERPSVDRLELGRGRADATGLKGL